MSRRVLAVVSDVHCGSTVGLCVPEPVELDEGATYDPSPAQLWLHAGWRAFWARVAQVKKDADSFGILTNGDLVDGDHHGTVQIVSRDLNVQSWILRKCFDPVLELAPDYMIVVRGTEAHVGKNASAEETFARHVAKQGIKVIRNKDTKTYSHWHFKGMLGDKLIDAAHHGRIGGRPWTRASGVTNLASQIVLEHAERGDPIPDLAIRSHYHTYVDTGDISRTRVVQTPAWQLHTAFAHKVVPECLSDIGGIIVTIEDGQPLTVEKFLHRPKKAPTTRVA